MHLEICSHHCLSNAWVTFLSLSSEKICHCLLSANREQLLAGVTSDMTWVILRWEWSEHWVWHHGRVHTKWKLYWLQHILARSGLLVTFLKSSACHESCYRRCPLLTEDMWASRGWPPQSLRADQGITSSSGRMLSSSKSYSVCKEQWSEQM